MASSAKTVAISFAGQTLTHFGGLVLLQQFFHRLGLRRLLTRTIRFPQRNHRYSVSESLLARLYPILLGLGRIETTRLLQHNGVFQYLTGLPVYPDPQTLRRFLGRFAEAGLGDFLGLHDRLRRQMLAQREPSPTLIFDLDSTVLPVYGRQEKAAVGFNPTKRGRPSYLPLLCLEGQTGDCWAAEYYPGNTHVATVTVPLWKAVCAKLPAGVRGLRVRADGAFLRPRDRRGLGGVAGCCRTSKSAEFWTGVDREQAWHGSPWVRSAARAPLKPLVPHLPSLTTAEPVSGLVAITSRRDHREGRPRPLPIDFAFSAHT
jgi:Transposase DDE domain group 1